MLRRLVCFAAIFRGQGDVTYWHDNYMTHGSRHHPDASISVHVLLADSEAPDVCAASDEDCKAVVLTRLISLRQAAANAHALLEGKQRGETEVLSVSDALFAGPYVELRRGDEVAPLWPPSGAGGRCETLERAEAVALALRCANATVSASEATRFRRGATALYEWLSRCEDRPEEGRLDEVSASLLRAVARCAAARGKPRVVYHLHLAKSGGSELCACARARGHATPGENCWPTDHETGTRPELLAELRAKRPDWLTEWADQAAHNEFGPRWLPLDAMAGASPSVMGSPPFYLDMGVDYERACENVLQLADRRGWSWISDESYTKLDAADAPPTVCCESILTVVALRNPTRRLASHLNHIGRFSARVDPASFGPHHSLPTLFSSSRRRSRTTTRSERSWATRRGGSRRARSRSDTETRPKRPSRISTWSWCWTTTTTTTTPELTPSTSRRRRRRRRRPRRVPATISSEHTSALSPATDQTHNNATTTKTGLYAQRSTPRSRHSTATTTPSSDTLEGSGRLTRSRTSSSGRHHYKGQ